MKIGIMQPYFLPYLGYFSMIKHVDSFIILDTVQFIRHGWIERNRILKQSGEWQYFSVPLLKHSRETIIKDIKINNELYWKEKIIAQLKHYRKAPYYGSVINLLNELFSDEYDDITTLVYKSLKLVCKYLGFDTSITIFSEMGLEVDTVNAPDEWALNICKAIPEVDEYWNAIGGIEFFDKNKYINANIELKFQKINLVVYEQKGNSFESGLSILDVMMFNSPEEINHMLDLYELL